MIQGRPVGVFAHQFPLLVGDRQAPLGDNELGIGQVCLLIRPFVEAGDMAHGQGQADVGEN